MFLVQSGPWLVKAGDTSAKSLLVPLTVLVSDCALQSVRLDGAVLGESGFLLFHRHQFPVFHRNWSLKPLSSFSPHSCGTGDDFSPSLVGSNHIS